MKTHPVSMTMIALALAGMISAASSAHAQADRYVQCTGEYALCDLAECEPIPAQTSSAGSKSIQPNTAICICDVKHGENMGPGSCEDRVGPKPDQLLSTYSLANSTAKDGSKKKYTLCSPGDSETPTSHTTCYGYPCQKIGNDQAKCTCPVFYNQAFVTLKGDCENPSVCTKGLLQGGTPTDSIALNAVFATVTDQPSPMQYCTDGAS